MADGWMDDESNNGFHSSKKEGKYEINLNKSEVLIWKCRIIALSLSLHLMEAFKYLSICIISIISGTKDIWWNSCKWRNNHIRLSTFVKRANTLLEIFCIWVDFAVPQNRLFTIRSIAEQDWTCTKVIVVGIFSIRFII